MWKSTFIEELIAYTLRKAEADTLSWTSVAS